MSFWADERRVDELRRLVDDGLTASAIALAMGAATRNTIIGKVQRLGLRLRGGVQVGRTEQATLPPPTRDEYLARERDRKNAAYAAKQASCVSSARRTGRSRSPTRSDGRRSRCN